VYVFVCAVFFVAFVGKRLGEIKKKKQFSLFVVYSFDKKVTVYICMYNIFLRYIIVFICQDNTFSP